MKINKPHSLTRRELRAIEQKLGIFLDAPVKKADTPTQQFGVYDEDEIHAGDISSGSKFFTSRELEDEIQNLFNR